MRGVRRPCLVVLLNEFESVVDVKSQRFATDPICALEQNSQNSLGIAHLFQAAGHVKPRLDTHSRLDGNAIALFKWRERERSKPKRTAVLCAARKQPEVKRHGRKKNQTNSCLVKKTVRARLRIVVRNSLFTTQHFSPF